MKLQKVSEKAILALLLPALIGLTGCAKIVLHPISKLDIQRMNKGKAYTPEKDGYFISDHYLNEVIEAKVE